MFLECVFSVGQSMATTILCWMREYIGHQLPEMIGAGLQKSPGSAIVTNPCPGSSVEERRPSKPQVAVSYPLGVPPSHGAYSSVAESQVVILVVIGSIPIEHPNVPCPGGEIGRHTALRGPRLTACRFDACPGHHAYYDLVLMAKSGKRSGLKTRRPLGTAGSRPVRDTSFIFDSHFNHGIR